MQKNAGQKSYETVPLNYVDFVLCTYFLFLHVFGKFLQYFDNNSKIIIRKYRYNKSSL